MNVITTRPPSRRGLLTGGTAALLAGAAIATVAHEPAVAASGAPGPDAELLRLLAALTAAHDAIARSNELEDDTDYEAAVDAALEAWWPLAEQIRATPAKTLPGLRAKADALRMMIERTICVSIGETIADLDAQEDEDAAKMGWSLARDLLAWSAVA
jgi:hypothetical protein